MAKGQKSTLTNSEKKEYAKLLFTRESLTQKEIAQRVGTSENTISNWVNAGKWETLRRSLMVTKDEQLSQLYRQLELLNIDIENAKGYPDSAQADVISKLTKAISQLETETNIGQIMEVCKELISYIQQDDLELAKELTVACQSFISAKLSTKS